MAPNMPGAFRRNLHRLSRRAQQTGPLEIRICRTPDELRQAFPVFLEVEASGWKGEPGSGTAISCMPNLVDFYRRIMEHYSVTGECVINLLVQNGTCIAGQFCVQMDGTLSILKVGYHEDYSKIAPGNLLMQQVLEASCRSGQIRTVSFVTDPVWCHPWRPSSTELFNQYLFNRTWRGVFAWLPEKCRRYVGNTIKGDT